MLPCISAMHANEPGLLCKVGAAAYGPLVKQTNNLYALRQWMGILIEDMFKEQLFKTRRTGLGLRVQWK